MSNLTDLQAAIEELDDEFGVSATLTRITKGSYNPATGKTAASSTAPVGITARFGRRKVTLENGTETFVETVRSKTLLNEGDTITAGPRKALVKKVTPIYFQTTVLEYLADVEGSTK
jgi:hypothetical protein